MVFEGRYVNFPRAVWLEVFCLMLCVCVCVYYVASVVFVSLQLYGLVAPHLLCQWASPGKNTRVGCHALLQGIFLPGIEPASLASPALAGRFFLPLAPPGKPIWLTMNQKTLSEATKISDHFIILPSPVSQCLLLEN